VPTLLFNSHLPASKLKLASCPLYFHSPYSIRALAHDKLDNYDIDYGILRCSCPSPWFRWLLWTITY